MTRFLIILLIALGVGDDGKRDGRKGNAHLRQDRLEEAASAYRDGLAEVPADALGTVPAGLLNNLGTALYRSEDFEGAVGALDASLRRAVEPADVARSSYNMGNALFKAESLEESLLAYRRALMTDPSSEDAKFNYEFVKRKLEEQQNQQQDQQENDEQNENQDQDQEQQNEEQQDQEQQEQDQQQDQQQDQEQQQQEQQQQPQQDPNELSPQEAQRILEALENEEEQLLRQVQKMKTRPRRVEKDW